MGENESKISYDEYLQWLEPFIAVRKLMSIGLDEERAIGWLSTHIGAGSLLVADVYSKKLNHAIILPYTDMSEISKISWRNNFWVSGSFLPAWLRDDNGALSGYNDPDRDVNPSVLRAARFDPEPILDFCGRMATPIENMPLSNQPNTASKRGAKRKDWWDDLWILVIEALLNNDLHFDSQADLQRWLESQVSHTLDREYGDSTLKPMASKLFKWLGENSGKIPRNGGK